jgi:hypothetical protein
MAKNYIKGSIREIQFNDDSSKLVLSILVSDLAKIANDRGYASVVINKRKETDQYGNTHYMYENDYNPEAAKKDAKKGAAPSKKADLKKPKFHDDAPF